MDPLKWNFELLADGYSSTTLKVLGVGTRRGKHEAKFADDACVLAALKKKALYYVYIGLYIYMFVYSRAGVNKKRLA